MNEKKGRIEICGNIASGKTSLCKNLSDICFDAIYESFHLHPFLDSFYKDQSKFSFETEITFLLQHYHSIKIANTDGIIVCDFSIVLDKAYADVTLPSRRRDLFMNVAEELEDEIGPPQKIIHLKCPEDVLLRRIKDRNRLFEKEISISYLSQIAQAIDARISVVSQKVEVMTIDSHEINFVKGLDEIPYPQKNFFRQI